MATNQPEKGKPTIELTGKTKSKLPSSASLNEKFSFSVGILEAQVEKHAPDKKKERPSENFILLIAILFGK